MADLDVCLFPFKNNVELQYIYNYYSDFKKTCNIDLEADFFLLKSVWRRFTCELTVTCVMHVLTWSFSSKWNKPEPHFMTAPCNTRDAIVSK